MNKNLLPLFALSAMLLACGSQDGGPPKLKDEWLSISPLDTLIAEFDSNLSDIDKLDTGNNVIADNAKFVSCLSKKKNELCFIGKNTTPGGSLYFDEDIKRDSVVFKKLKNSDGTRKQTTLYYSTLKIVDDIKGYANFSTDAAIDLDPFFANNAKKLDFAGVLDHNVGIADKYNMNDYYRISLKMNDSIVIEIKSRDSLSVTFSEPGKNSINDVTQVKKVKVNGKDVWKAEYNKLIGGGHLDLTDVAGKEAYFYIKVSDDKANNPPNPYTLSISLPKK